MNEVKHPDLPGRATIANCGYAASVLWLGLLFSIGKLAERKGLSAANSGNTRNRMK
jgi:hypothetical protein